MIRHTMSSVFRLKQDVSYFLFIHIIIEIKLWYTYYHSSGCWWCIVSHI